jgi:hypothetical protein
VEENVFSSIFFQLFHLLHTEEEELGPPLHQVLLNFLPLFFKKSA